MSLIIPITTHSFIQTIQANTTAAGVRITGNTSTANVKGPWTQLLASSGEVCHGITLMIGSANTLASTARRKFVDVGIGAAASEIVIIPDLDCGNVNNWGQATSGPVVFTFPIKIPAGTRISARMQAEATTNNTVDMLAFLHKDPIGPNGWWGTRVTAYGANTTTTMGVAHSPANGSYATPTEITAACTNPIKYFQVGMDLNTDTTGDTARCMMRIGVGATPNYIVSDLPYYESTTVEAVDFTMVNFLLSKMLFDIPQSTRLTVSAMRNATATARGFTLYGVD
jgi:hypothetical protein